MNPTVRRILYLAVGVIVAFLAFRLLDVLMVFSLYSWIFQIIREASGMPDALTGALSIWFVAIVILLLPTLFSVVFLKRRPKNVALIAAAISGWLVIVYCISLPQEGRFFNPVTGKSMFRYSRAAECKIELFPLGYKFHPRYGTELAVVTREVVREIDRCVAEAARLQALEKERQSQAAQAAQSALQIAQREQEAEQAARREADRVARAELENRDKEIAQAGEEKRAIVEAKVGTAKRALAEAEKGLDDERARSIFGAVPQLRRAQDGSTYIGPESGVPLRLAEAKVEAAKRALAQAREEAGERDAKISQSEATQRAEAEAKLVAAEQALAIATGELEYQDGRSLFGQMPQLRRAPDGSSYVGPESQVPLRLAKAKVEAAKRAVAQAREEAALAREAKPPG